MAKIIEAKAIIGGEEKVSPLLDKLAKKFDQVQKTAKGTEGIDKAAAALARVQKQMEAIDRYSSSSSGFAKARENYRKAVQDVEAAARAMREGQGEARKLASDYERAQRAVRAASRALEAQKAAAIADKRVLDELGISGGRIAEQQKRIAAAVDRATAAMDRQHKKAGRLREQIGNVGSTIGLIAGPGVLHATREAVKSGATVQSEVVKMRAAGIPEDEINSQLGVSADLAAKYPNVGRSDILETYKELRSVLAHSKEAPELIDIAVKTRSALNAIDPSGHAGSALQFAYKAAEVEGMAQDPQRFASAMNAFVKAYQVMGKTITPELIMVGAQNLKSSAATLSDRFKWTTYLSMLQEMGPRAGAGVNNIVRQFTGSFRGQNAAAKEWIRLGLANRDDFLTTRAGEVKGLKPGKHVVGWKTGVSAPDQYVWKYLIPAMEKRGITSVEDQVAEAIRLFPDARGSDVVAKMIQQRESFENHAKLYHEAQGVNATIETNRHDPFAGFNSLSTSIESFAGVVTSPVMDKAAVAMNSMASMIGHWGAELDRLGKLHPTEAAIASAGAIGVAGYYGITRTWGLVSGIFNGFGLKGSAVALDGAAVALTEAAAALGGSSVAKAAGAAAAGGAARGALGVVAGTAAAAAGIYFGSTEEANAGERDIYKRDPTTGEMVLTPYGKSLQQSLSPASVTPTEVELKGSAEVRGEAKITIEIPGLPSRIVNVPLKGTVSANGPGSLGVSSPDASAAPVGHN